MCNDLTKFVGRVWCEADDFTKTYVTETRPRQQQYWLDHARTMIMMYKASRDEKYLIEARSNVISFRQSISDYPRPMGVLKVVAA